MRTRKEIEEEIEERFDNGKVSAKSKFPEAISIEILQKILVLNDAQTETLLDIRDLLAEQKAKSVPCPLCHDSKCNGSRHFQVGAGAAGPNLPTYGTNE